MALKRSPLDLEHKAIIDRGLEDLKIAQEQINLAQAANIDVTAQRQKLTETRDRLMQLKRTYFPNQ